METAMNSLSEAGRIPYLGYIRSVGSTCPKMLELASDAIL